MVITRWCFWAVAMAAQAGLPTAENDEQSTDPQGFLSSYRPGLQQLEQFYSQIRARGTQIHTTPRDTMTVDFEFAINRARHRYVTTVKADSGSPSQLGRVLVRVADPRLSFHLVRWPSQSDFAIQWAGVASGDEFEKQVHNFRLTLPLSLTALSVCQVPISELLQWEGFAIHDVVSAPRGEHELRKVHFTSKSPWGLSFGGWFAVCPHCAWAVQEYEVRQYKPEVDDPSKPMVGRGLVEYVRGDQGIPLMRKAELAWSLDGKIGERYECSFDQIAHESVPAEEFTLAAFGIPQPGPLIGVPPLAFWAILFATVAFVCSVLLRCRRGHRRAA